MDMVVRRWECGEVILGWPSRAPSSTANEVNPSYLPFAPALETDEKVTTLDVLAEGSR